jgi:hypothetical protein
LALHFNRVIAFNWLWLIIHNFYLELCILVEQTNITKRKSWIVSNRNGTEPCLKLDQFKIVVWKWQELEVLGSKRISFKNSIIKNK